MPANWLIDSSPRINLSGRSPRRVREQSTGRPSTQRSQLPHDGTNESTTRSPGLTLSTPAPTFSTVPADSCPRIVGRG